MPPLFGSPRLALPIVPLGGERIMNKKLAVVSLVMLLLIYATPKRIDHAENVLEAVDMFTRVAQINPAPEKIQETIGYEGGPSRENISDGSYGLKFIRPDGEMQYTFRIYDGRIKWMTSYEQYNLPRGVTYELLEREYVKTLTQRFGFTPKIEEVNVKGINHPDLIRKSYIWNNIEMYIRYDERQSVKKSIFYLMRKKRDEIAVFIIYNK
jgi:hypothetical protein